MVSQAARAAAPVPSVAVPSVAVPGAALRSLLGRYYEALPSGAWQSLPLADDARYTENGQDLPFGRGLWRTATGAAPVRAMIVADEPAGQIAGWGMVTEAGQDAILGVRLRVAPDSAGGGGRITEAEAFAIRKNDMATGGSGFMDPDRLRAPTQGLLDVVPEAERPTREELVAAADGYLDGVSGDNADLVPVADDCKRFENGIQTVLRTEGWPPGAELNPVTSMGVAQQMRENLTRHIWAADDRGMYLTDTSRGLVMVRFMFDHPGRVHGWEGRAAFVGPNSMPAWETFKVRGGRIRHIEAIISIFPYGMRWGW